ncbi:MAG: tRNA (guanosine(46)-N7)-methyltransferase TrmB [Actinomycetaceae bacterium]|nr:tRNA (guanosine(46)-N7)-methyltransferase TrmB [Actinomycetaceae bacterium]
MSPEQQVPYLARTKSFTRRGRGLHASTQRTWDEHGDKYLIDVPRDGGYTTVDPSFRIEPKVVFGRSAPLVIEIGSGNGEQIVDFAARHQDHDLLAFEVWTEGLGKTVSRAVETGVSNIRLVEADVAQCLPFILPDQCATEVWTFFPDPWRKARHHKRRLVQPAFAREVARVLKDGGVWRLATDWEDYAWQMRDVVESVEEFANPHQGQRPHPHDPEGDRGGFAPRFAQRVLTRFEERGQLSARPAFDLVAVRMPRGEGQS